jgi:hypothetical protein
MKREAQNKKNIVKRRILILDNTSAHVLDYLCLPENVKIVDMPLRTTPVLQPVDQGVISAFKLYYTMF